MHGRIESVPRGTFSLSYTLQIRQADPTQLTAYMHPCMSKVEQPLGRPSNGILANRRPTVSRHDDWISVKLLLSRKVLAADLSLAHDQGGFPRLRCEVPLYPEAPRLIPASGTLTH